MKKGSMTNEVGNATETAPERAGASPAYIPTRVLGAFQSTSVTVEPLTDVMAWKVCHFRDPKRRWSDQAIFYVRSGSGWVSVSVQSSYGSWSHRWPSIGPVDWRAFLADCDCGYVMGKFMGSAYRKPDVAATVARMRSAVLEQRRGNWCSKEVAREAWDALEEAADLSMDDFMSTVSGTRFFCHDYYEFVVSRPDPLAVAFWHELWRPWVTSLVEPAAQPGSASAS